MLDAITRRIDARLMRDNGIKALQKRRYKKTTDSDHGGLVAPNLLDQDFATGSGLCYWIRTLLLDQDFACDGPDQTWLLGDVNIAFQLTGSGQQLCMDA